MTYTLRHHEPWDHSGSRVGNKYIPAYVTFVGEHAPPGRAFQMPYKEWKALGKPEEVTVTVTALRGEEWIKRQAWSGKCWEA